MSRILSNLSSKIQNKYQVSEKDLQIFHMLQQNPDLSGHAISKELNFISQDVRNRIQTMKELGLLRKDEIIQDQVLGARSQTELEGIYKPSMLGLMRIHVIFENIPSIKQLRLLEAFCEFHPATHYRVILLGDILNLYVQMDIPEGASKLFEEIMRSLQVLKLFESSTLFETYATADSKFDMVGWEIWKNRKDAFLQYVQDDKSTSDVFSGPSYVEFLWRDFLENNESYELEIGLPTDNSKLNKLDALLIRELTINAKIPIAELSERYGKDRTTITRRMKKIRSIVPKNQLYYDMEAFGMSTSIIIKGEFNDSVGFNMNNFNSFIKSNKLPLNTNLVMDNDNFMWYITAPAIMIPELTYFSWSLTSSHKIYQVYTQTAKKYFFNSNLVDDSGKWVTQRDMLVDDPIDLLNKIM